MADDAPPPPQFPLPAALDPNEADEGLALDSSEPSSTSSVSDSIREFRLQNGRTYHSFHDGKYRLPNDDREKERLDVQHNLFGFTFDGKLGLCPMASKDAHVGRVLDVGCGTGSWLIDFAEDHPEAVVVGTDLSPIQPEFAPPNVRYLIHDMEEDDWGIVGTSDFIMSRMMTGCFRDWRGYLKKCYDNLNPGGYLELEDNAAMYQSDDGTLTEDLTLVEWRRLLIEAAETSGRPFTDPTTYKPMMEEIGFVDVCESMEKWPLHDWPSDERSKDLGRLMRQNMTLGLEGFTMRPLSQTLEWSSPRIQLLLVGVRKDLNNPDIHAYLPIYTVFGRKPV